MKYMNYSLETIKELIKETQQDKCFVIYINYEKKDGIEISNSIDNLENSMDNFYKVYIFNEETMITCFNFDEDKKMIQVNKKDMSDTLEEKYIYLKEEDITKVKGSNYKLIKINIGNIEGKEVFQYAELVGEING